jgi:hypothetical protein
METLELADIKKMVKESDFERFMGNFVNNIYWTYSQILG